MRHFDPSVKLKTHEIDWGYGVKGSQQYRFRNESWRQVEDIGQLVKLQSIFNEKERDEGQLL